MKKTFTEADPDPEGLGETPKADTDPQDLGQTLRADPDPVDLDENPEVGNYGSLNPGYKKTPTTQDEKPGAVTDPDTLIKLTDKDSENHGSSEKIGEDKRITTTPRTIRFFTLDNK